MWTKRIYFFGEINWEEALKMILFPMHRFQDMWLRQRYQSRQQTIVIVQLHKASLLEILRKIGSSVKLNVEPISNFNFVDVFHGSSPGLSNSSSFFKWWWFLSFCRQKKTRTKMFFNDKKRFFFLMIKKNFVNLHQNYAVGRLMIIKILFYLTLTQKMLTFYNTSNTFAK